MSWWSIEELESFLGIVLSKCWLWQINQYSGDSVFNYSWESGKFDSSFIDLLAPQLTHPLVTASTLAAQVKGRNLLATHIIYHFIYIPIYTSQREMVANLGTRMSGGGGRSRGCNTNHFQDSICTRNLFTISWCFISENSIEGQQLNASPFLSVINIFILIDGHRLLRTRAQL